jgi:hypothetical protein
MYQNKVYTQSNVGGVGWQALTNILLLNRKRELLAARTRTWGKTAQRGHGRSAGCPRYVGPYSEAHALKRRHSHSVVMDETGRKRKFKENPLTAKAETGSLKIKLVRKGDLQSSAMVRGGGLDGYALNGVPRSPSKTVAAPPQPVPSPPKPRANRKHVPIFYQRPNAFDISASTSSTEEVAVSQTQSLSSDYEQSSASSTTGRFAQLDIAPGLPGSLQDPMPPTNPLFTRGMSETSGSLTDLLKTVLPTVPSMESTGGSYGDYSGGLSSAASESLRASAVSLMNPAAALRQLASSSAAYTSHTRETTLLPPMQLHHALERYPTQQPLPHHHTTHSGHQDDDYENGYEHEPSISSASEEVQEHHDRKPDYRFDAMSALQNAVKIAVASTSPMTTHATSAAGTRWPVNGNDGDESDLGPPPSGPPGLSIEHSLMGGGIEAPASIPTINTVNFNWNRYQQEKASARSGASSRIPTASADEPSGEWAASEAPVMQA